VETNPSDGGTRCPYCLTAPKDTYPAKTFQGTAWELEICCEDLADLLTNSARFVTTVPWSPEAVLQLYWIEKGHLFVCYQNKTPRFITGGFLVLC